jgi:hypothetical protein
VVRVIVSSLRFKFYENRSSGLKVIDLLRIQDGGGRHLGFAIRLDN